MSAKRPIRDLERDLKREPGNLAVRLTLAAAYRESGRAADAVELYRSVARAYLEQGRPGQASAVCRSALEIAPLDSELFGMLNHIERTGAQTQPPPFGTPIGGAPSMPVWGSTAAPMPHAPPHATTMLGGAAAPHPAPPAAPAPHDPGPPSRPARVIEADVAAMREVGSVAPTVKHVPPPPPRMATPTGRHSGLDIDTPLPDPLPLHETTGRDSLVEMAELLTGPSRPSPPSSPSLPMPATLLPPLSPSSPAPNLRVAPGRGPAAPASGGQSDDDSETIVPLTQVRGQASRPPSKSPVAADVVRAAISPRSRPTPSPVPTEVRRPAPTRPPPVPRPPAAPPPPPATMLPRLTAITSPPPPVRVAPKPAPIDDAPTQRGARPANADVAAEMVTRKRPKLSAHDLSILDLGPLSIESAMEAADDAVTNPGPRASAGHHHGPDSGTATARHPAPHVDDDDTGDTGETDTGRTGQAPFDDEPTHPPDVGGDDGTLRGDVPRPGPGQRAATEDAATELGRTFEPSFDATLSSLGPDGSVLEGPLGVFSILPHEAAHELARRAVVKQFDPGEVIIREGDPGDACYVIAHGVVVVQRRVEDEGEPVELARLTDGSMFGEFALLADRRRHATVLALTDVEVFEIPRLLLRELAAVFPEVGPALERFYRERLLANLLRTTPLFTLVPDEHRPALLARFHPLHADSGQAVVRQGERAGGLYLIVLGAVEVVRKVGERRAVVLATLGEGSYFGEMALLSGEMASASVIAAGPCELAVLPPRDFYDLVAQNPGLWTTMRSVAEARRLANANIMTGHTGVV